MLYGRNIVCAHIESLPMHGFLFLLARCVCEYVSIYACLALCFIDIIAHYMTKTYVKNAKAPVERQSAWQIEI